MFDSAPSQSLYVSAMSSLDKSNVSHAVHDTSSAKSESGSLAPRTKVIAGSVRFVADPNAAASTKLFIAGSGLTAVYFKA